MLDDRFFPPPARRLTRVSFVAWAIGVAPLLLLMLDSFLTRHRTRDEVSGGLKVSGFLIAFALVVVGTVVGIVCGVMATRAAPESRAARIALRTNVISLGVFLAAVGAMWFFASR